MPVFVFSFFCVNFILITIVKLEPLSRTGTGSRTSARYTAYRVCPCRFTRGMVDGTVLLLTRTRNGHRVHEDGGDRNNSV